MKPNDRLCFVLIFFLIGIMCWHNRELYKNLSLQRERMDILSKRLDIANARIHSLENEQK